MTLIAIYLADGGVRTCNLLCYGASPSSPCTCVCEGRNHGRGLSFASANTIKHADAYRAKQKTVNQERDISASTLQLPLFA